MSLKPFLNGFRLQRRNKFTLGTITLVAFRNRWFSRPLEVECQSKSGYISLQTGQIPDWSSQIRTIFDKHSNWLTEWVSFPPYLRCQLELLFCILKNIHRRGKRVYISQIKSQKRWMLLTCRTSFKRLLWEVKIIIWGVNWSFYLFWKHFFVLIWFFISIFLNMTIGQAWLSTKLKKNGPIES